MRTNASACAVRTKKQNQRQSNKMSYSLKRTCAEDVGSIGALSVTKETRKELWEEAKQRSVFQGKPSRSLILPGTLEFTLHLTALLFEGK